MPPTMIKPVKPTVKIPQNQAGIWKAVLKASEMELACTIVPIKPKAMMSEIEKNVARALERSP